MNRTLSLSLLLGSLAAHAQSDGGIDLPLEGKLDGVVQADGRGYFDATPARPPDAFVLRRARLDGKAILAEKYTGRIEIDVAGGALALPYAYVEAAPWPWLAVRVGKTKSPVGLEVLQSERFREILEQPFTSDLVPNREIGVMLNGAWEKLVEYQLGAFNGNFDNGLADQESGDPKDLQGRVFVHPFARLGIAPLAGLGVGAAGTYGRARGSPGKADLPTYQSSGRATIFSYAADALQDGVRTRVDAQANWYWDRVSASFEWVQSTIEATHGAAHASMSHAAWAAHAGVMLTHDKASYGEVTPNGKYGALQLVARAQGLAFSQTAFDQGFADPTKSVNSAFGLLIGANWYLNAHFKLGFNFERTAYTGGDPGGDRPTELFALARAQAWW